jgi:orotate phosphoribosyltransferase
MTYQEDRDRLKALLCEFSVRHGDFVLASGQRSNIYIDAKLTTCRAAAMPLIGRVFLRKIRERGWMPVAVGGLTMGADPIVTAIARESLEGDQIVNSFLIRKEPKKHGRQRFLEGLEETRGLPVVIVDDVCTKGESTAKAIEYSRSSGLEVLGAICLVDREAGARELLSQHGCELLSVFCLRELIKESEEYDSGRCQGIAC